MKYQGEINLVAGAYINFLFLIQDKTWLRTLMIIHFLAFQLEPCQREKMICVPLLIYSFLDRSSVDECAVFSVIETLLPVPESLRLASF